MGLGVGGCHVVQKMIYSTTYSLIESWAKLSCHGLNSLKLISADLILKGRGLIQKRQHIDMNMLTHHNNAMFADSLVASLRCERSASKANDFLFI